MTGVPEKGRDGRTGASHRPCLWNCLGASSVHGLSPPVCKGFTPDTRRPTYPPAKARERRIFAIRGPSAGREGSLDFREARGIGPSGARPFEARPRRASCASESRGPTGRAELVCGRGATHRANRVDRGRPTPWRSGTCLLRRLWGSAALLTGSRGRETPESGCGR